MEAVSTLVRLLETIIVNTVVDTVCHYVHRWIDKHS